MTVDRLGLIALLLAQWLFGWSCAPADGRVGRSPTLVVMATDCGAACERDMPARTEPGSVPLCPMECWECVVLAPPTVDVPPKPTLPEPNDALPALEAPMVAEVASRGRAVFAALETGPPRERRGRSRLCVWVI